MSERMEDELIAKIFSNSGDCGKDCDDYDRRKKRHWTEFKTPEQYVKDKLKMLQRDMCINPTESEIEHLNSLKSAVDIDNAVRSIISRHWSDV